MKEFFVSGQPDVNGVHALVRFALLLIVFAATVWKLRRQRDAT
ncbi:MAG: hypothetical protein FD139_723 [Methylocystaceae bacterium]|nr:MAG: hypothetical protein FD148_40 [Methylocystaceae bacterium]KAF0213973.1 MAG: hypothetical protein FD172_97 [Methylocystaceae bacterium]TXT46878.1 MAG: hypothetical protein FD139_723 [Methylocystaceae bacterium]